METNEPWLLLAWRGGDRRAGQLLFGNYIGMLRRFFATKTGSDSEDLVQTTLLTCISVEHHFEARSSFRTFLLGIARRVLLKHLRARARRCRIIELDEVSLAALDAEPSAVQAKEQSIRRLVDALRRLPLRTQRLLELHYWKNLTGREMAGVLGISEAAVWSRIHRAKLDLGKTLGPDSDESP